MPFIEQQPGNEESANAEEALDPQVSVDVNAAEFVEPWRSFVGEMCVVAHDEKNAERSPAIKGGKFWAGFGSDGQCFFGEVQVSLESRSRDSVAFQVTDLIGVLFVMTVAVDIAVAGVLGVPRR